MCSSFSLQINTLWVLHLNYRQISWSMEPKFSFVTDHSLQEHITRVLATEKLHYMCVTKPYIISGIINKSRKNKTRKNVPRVENVIFCMINYRYPITFNTNIPDVWFLQFHESANSTYIKPSPSTVHRPYAEADKQWIEQKSYFTNLSSSNFLYTYHSHNKSLTDLIIKEVNCVLVELEGEGLKEWDVVGQYFLIRIVQFQHNDGVNMIVW